MLQQSSWCASMRADALHLRMTPPPIRTCGGWLQGTLIKKLSRDPPMTPIPHPGELQGLSTGINLLMQEVED